MKRIFLTVLDACGVGELPDAADYGDVGACTIGHAVDACHPSLPNMAHMGLGQIAGAHYPADENAVGAFGMCREASKGKDTTTGHWEIAGVTRREERVLLRGALEGLGGCPAQEEEQRLAYAQTQLETALDAARAEAAQQRRLYRTLGLSLGGAAALLLL